MTRLGDLGWADKALAGETIDITHMVFGASRKKTAVKSTSSKKTSTAVVAEMVTIADKINEQFRRGHEAGMVHFLKCGQLLQQQQNNMKHGLFATWVKTNCPDISYRTARAYMQAARRAQELGIDFESGSALPFRSLRELLPSLETKKASNSTPIPAGRLEVKKQALPEKNDSIGSPRSGDLTPTRYPDTPGIELHDGGDRDDLDHEHRGDDVLRHKSGGDDGRRHDDVEHGVPTGPCDAPKAVMITVRWPTTASAKQIAQAIVDLYGEHWMRAQDIANEITKITKAVILSKPHSKMTFTGSQS